MTHPDTLAAIAREQIRDFLGEPQAARQASLAHAARSPARSKHVVLPDASKVLIRPVRSDDAQSAEIAVTVVDDWQGLYQAALVTLAREHGYDQELRPVSQPC